MQEINVLAFRWQQRLKAAGAYAMLYSPVSIGQGIPQYRWQQQVRLWYHGQVEFTRYTRY